MEQDASGRRDTEEKDELKGRKSNLVLSPVVDDYCFTMGSCCRHFESMGPTANSDTCRYGAGRMSCLRGPTGRQQ